MASKDLLSFLGEVKDDGTFEMLRPEDSANYYAGIWLNSGYTLIFGGYSIPLLDPVENDARETAQSDTCASWWTPYLGYHVSTTSTATTYVRDNECWRMYFQDARIARDFLEQQ